MVLAWARWISMWYWGTFGRKPEMMEVKPLFLEGLEEAVGGVLEGGESGVVEVLDLELEAAGAAEPADGGRGRTRTRASWMTEKASRRVAR